MVRTRGRGGEEGEEGRVVKVGKKEKKRRGEIKGRQVDSENRRLEKERRGLGE